MNELSSNRILKKDLSTEKLKSYQQQLLDKGIVDISEIFLKKAIKTIVNESIRLLNHYSQRRDYIDENNSPRNLNNVKEETINENSILLKNFYYHCEILNILTLICNENIYTVPFEGERYIINGLTKKNDSHGWHLDDYSYALVYICNSPHEKSGGLLEFIPYVLNKVNAAQIQNILKKNTIHKKWFAKGSVYLMRSNCTLHRVSNIIDGERIALVTAYCNESDLSKEIDHTNTLLLAGKIKS